jgi:hypothetical protein
MAPIRDGLKNTAAEDRLTRAGSCQEAGTGACEAAPVSCSAWASASAASLGRRSLLALPALALGRDAVAGQRRPLRVFDPAGPRLDRRGLVPTFAEEFNSFERSEGRGTRWRTVLGYGGPFALANRTFPRSGQQQMFVSREALGSGGTTPLGIEPFHLDNGVLAIEASRTPPEAAHRLWNYPYVSGLITTKFSFAQLYGHFEARIRMPAGRGFWPAFWLLPQDNRWPPEIDVVEMLGHDPRIIYLSWHSTAPDGRKVDLTERVRVPDTSADFHLYGVTWTREEIIWYFDEVELWRQPTPHDMHSPMFLLLNFSVGGRWPGNPDATTSLPARMLIDTVRAWALR